MVLLFLLLLKIIHNLQLFCLFIGVCLWLCLCKILCMSLLFALYMTRFLLQSIDFLVFVYVCVTLLIILSTKSIVFSTLSRTSSVFVFVRACACAMSKKCKCISNHHFILKNCHKNKQFIQWDNKNNNYNNNNKENKGKNYNFKSNIECDTRKNNKVTDEKTK